MTTRALAAPSRATIDPANLDPADAGVRRTSTATSTAAGSTPTRSRPSTAPGARSHEVNERNQDAAAPPARATRPTPPAPRGTRRPDGRRLLRRRHGRGGDRGRRASTPLAAVPRRASTRPRRSPTSAALVARAAARRRRRPALAGRHAPTSRTRTPTSSTSGQGGLGLPERDYYIRDDERLGRAPRRVRGPHRRAARQPRRRAMTRRARRPSAILAFETRLAEASLPAEQLRDVQLTHEPARRRRARRADARASG